MFSETGWLIERRKDDFETVKVPYLHLQDQCLIFSHESSGRLPTYILNASEWVSISEADE